MSLEPNEDMATLASESPSHSPPFHRRRKSWARRVERICCQTLAYFPLTFVYGLTTWAIYVEVQVSSLGLSSPLTYVKAGLGILLYSLANISYTIAVFTPPGSPLDPRINAAGRRKGNGYEGLPTHEDEDDEEESGNTRSMSTVTAKSDGKARFCKKCQSVKPDRTHHCSSCKKCVLKMDHHCPWLATCAGLHNYKPFLLFLIYVSLFCWTCFAVSAIWVWTEFLDEIPVSEGWRVVNTILLAVLGGIMGLVLTAFTAWHIYLAVTGQTTIESLEKTRYLSPLRKSMEHQFQQGRTYLGQSAAEGETSVTDQLKEIHANALPGVLRPEEGEERSGSVTPVRREQRQASDSPARDSLQRSFASLEAQREQERYEAYLDERDSNKLPNAFNLGWKRNLLHVFGEHPLLWALPVCNTTGDGWQWEVSSRWTAARSELARARAQRRGEDARWDSHSQASFQPPSARNGLRWTPGQGFIGQPHSHPPPLKLYGGQANGDGSPVPMQPIDRRGANDEVDGRAVSTASGEAHQSAESGATANWNDVPDDFLAPRGSGARSRSRGRTKGD